ncbi:MAG: SRPBCC domain-containing protein [Gemmatimonadetes bacterium]|nr:SRPBCC domain-containing protein [Gemmatimonadota bacterium]
MNNPIIVRTHIPGAKLGHVFVTYTTPADICRWNAASDDWHTTSAVLELRPGGRFCYRMEARDGSMGFDFEGTVEIVTPPRRLTYRIGDGRAVVVTFTEASGGVDVEVRFEAEQAHTRELQAQGWQAILDRFAVVAAEHDLA